MPEIAHPSDEQLSAYNLGQLPPDEAQEIESHISECSPCCDTIVCLSADDTFVGLLRQASDLPDSRSDLTLDYAGPSPATQTNEIPPALTSHPRYEVVGLTGKGGMGAVYKARHRMMDRTVALKIINREFVRKPEAVDRFHREVKAAAQLSHPNIVTAFDAEQADDVHYLVMEFVDGTDLSQIIKQRGALPITEACEYARQAAFGLQHAHECGMVHRDIKPHNLMVTSDGTVKILDFGLASLAPDVSSVEDHDTIEASSDLTVAGTVMGTPDFISPEQAKDARGADIRSDIYSLGTTLYYMLSGQPPFTEGSVMQKLKSHAQADPTPVDSLRDDVPAQLVTVLNKMMAKNADDRFQTPAEVADALQTFVITTADASSSGQLAMDGCAQSPPHISRTTGYRPSAGFLGVLLAMVACIFGWFAFDLPYAKETREAVAQLFAAPEKSELEKRLERGQVTAEATFDMVNLNVDLAERLVGKTEHVTFSKLETLSPEVAAVLAKHPENLSFPALKEISLETAQALSGKKLVWISLQGLKEISPAVAGELAKANYGLSLGDVEPETAKILGRREGTTSLGLTAITADVAEALSQHKGWLSLNNLQSIDSASAAALAKHRHWLSLNGLKELKPGIAEAFGNFEGKTLDLNGVQSIDVDVATKLASAECQGGGLYLNGLTTVSPEIVKTLANGNAKTLSFQGLKQITPETQRALDKVRNTLKNAGGALLVNKQIAVVPAKQPSLKITDRVSGSSGRDQTDYRWKLEGYNVGEITVRLLLAREGKTKVAREFKYVKSADDCKGEIRLTFTDESMPEHQHKVNAELKFVPTGLAHAGDLTSPKVFPTTIDGAFAMSAARSPIGDVSTSDTTLLFHRGVWSGDLEHRDSLQGMIDATKKGATFVFVTLDWKPVGDPAIGNSAPQPNVPVSGKMSADNMVRRLTQVHGNLIPKLHSMISEAAGVPNGQWDKFARDPQNSPAAINGEPLSIVLWGLNPLEAAKKNLTVLKDFQYIGGVPKPRELSKAMSGSRALGYHSMIQSAYISGLSYNVKAGTLNTAQLVGDCRIQCPLYSGQVNFVIKVNEDTDLEVSEFSLPNYGITIVRDEEGVWKRDETAPGTARATKQPAEKDGLTQNINRELSRLKEFTACSHDVIAKLKLELNPMVASMLKSGDVTVQPRIPPDAILDAIVRSATQDISDNPALTTYIEDLQERRDFAEFIAMQAYVYYVDTFAGLNSRQWEQVRQIGAKLHRQGSLQPHMLIFDHRSKSSTERKLLENTLTQQQLEYLRKDWRSGRRREELSDALSLVAERKIQQVDAEVKLSTAQRRKLDFVSKKTIVPDVVQYRLTALNVRAKKITRKESGFSLLEASSVSTARIPCLFAAERWQNFVKSTLNEEQWKTWKQFIDRRREAAIDTQAFEMNCFPMSKLTCQQQMAVHKLFRRAIEHQGVKLINAFVLFPDRSGLPEVATEQDFIDAISQENWKHVGFMTKRMALGSKVND